jgi:hypothetical protein
MGLSEFSFGFTQLPAQLQHAPPAPHDAIPECPQ